MKTVAIIGANNDRSKYANMAVRAFQGAGYHVYPVNPAFEKVENLPCFKTITDVPVVPDIVSVYVGPTRLLPLLPLIAERGCGELWMNPGTTSAEVLNEVQRLGLKSQQLCSIIAVGYSPSQLAG